MWKFGCTDELFSVVGAGLVFELGGASMPTDEEITHVPHDKCASMVWEAISVLNRRIMILYWIVGCLGGLCLALAVKVFGQG